MADSEDGFVDIIPEKEAKALAAAVTIGAKENTRSGKKALSITFHPDRLDADTNRVLLGPRFNIAFNAALRCIRIKAADGMGKFEMRESNLHKSQALTIRFPFPPTGVAFVEGRVPCEIDVNLSQGSIMVDLPKQMWPAPAVKALPPPAVRDLAAAEIRARIATPAGGNRTAELMGDPVRGRSALDQKRERGE